MKKYITVLTIFIMIFVQILTEARPFRVGQVPNGSKFSCNTCHTSGGGTPLNDFGTLLMRGHLVQSGSQFNVNWSPLLASLDADNDGVSNGQEFQDPFGIFMEGSMAPGNSDLVTSAGLLNSNPFDTLNVNFTGMTPHDGQQLNLRIFNKTLNKEIIRTSTTVSESFNIALNSILQGHSYNIDFYADLNGNNEYDAPPTDHAWRIMLDNAEASPTINFSHNTEFTDIEWQNMLTVNFASMEPHVGQLLELRVEDDLTSQEVGRKRIEFIPSAEFSINIPGIEKGREYNIEFYADFNGNGIFDEPPTDHSWEVKFENNTGDHIIDFSHNTDFKDIGWKYLYSLNFMDMTPHIGQLLEMRIVRNDNSEEVNRTSVMVPADEFVLSIPQIETDHDYNVDFYADLNGNGIYDAPPTDHAWRMTFNSSTGNFVQNFTHSTDFVDINWNNLTSVDEETIANNYTLNQNYPNPFNPTTVISFNLPEATNITLTVYNILGEKVSDLFIGALSSGLHEINFDASNLESGTYYYRLKTDSRSETKKMILLK